MPETCRVFDNIKFGKFVRLVGFIEKKFVTMHGHMNVKFGEASIPVTLRPPHISHGPTRNRNQPPRWHTGEQEPELRHGATLCTISSSYRDTEHSETTEGSKGCVAHESQKQKYSVQRVKCGVLEVKMSSHTVFEG